MDEKNIKEYSNTEITIVWEQKKCIHSTVCWKGATGLPQVFNPRNRPWITINGADSELIMHQIDQCPSGALSYYKNEKSNAKGI